MNMPETNVVGASLLSLLPGIDPAAREAIQLAVLMAQRVAESDHREGLVQDWFSHYRRQLQFYGWDAQTAEQRYRPDPQRRGAVERSLHIVQQVAGERHARSLQASLQALAENGSALWQMQQRSRQMNLFQLLPCAPSEDGNLDIVLYHEVGELALFGFDFPVRIDEASRVRAELVRFNPRLFQRTHADKVRQALGRILHEEIIALPV